MTMNEKIQIAMLMTLLLWLFQVIFVLTSMLIKRTLRQITAARQTKNGKTRCQHVFHAHCQKPNDGHETHVNETNMVAWQ